jgi:hypothetical protein
MTTDTSLRYLPNTKIPAIVFANKGSGGGKGHTIIAKFQHWLGENQVCQLPDDPRIMKEYTTVSEDGSTVTKRVPHPEIFVKKFIQFQTNIRVIVCGGDGTMAWIMSALDRIDHHRGSFPIAMMPLGTGNDLARQFHWGDTFRNSFLKESFMDKVAKAHPTGFDRWRIRFGVEISHDPDNELKRHLPATCTVGRGCMTEGAVANKTGSWITATHITDVGDRPSLSASHVNEVRMSHSQLPEEHEDHKTKFGHATELAKHVPEDGKWRQTGEVTPSQTPASLDDEVLRASVASLESTEKFRTVDAVWCNYFSIGQSIAIPYVFHKARRYVPFSLCTHKSESCPNTNSNNHNNNNIKIEDKVLGQC